MEESAPSHSTTSPAPVWRTTPERPVKDECGVLATLVSMVAIVWTSMTDMSVRTLHDFRTFLAVSDPSVQRTFTELHCCCRLNCKPIKHIHLLWVHELLMNNDQLQTELKVSICESL